MNHDEELHFYSVIIGAFVACAALAVGLALAMGWIR
jgi:hypothetical protein